MNLARLGGPSCWPPGYGWVLLAVQTLVGSSKPTTEESIGSWLAENSSQPFETVVVRFLLNDLVRNNVLSGSSEEHRLTQFHCTPLTPTITRHEIGRDYEKAPPPKARPQPLPKPSRTPALVTIPKERPVAAGHGKRGSDGTEEEEVTASGGVATLDRPKHKPPKQRITPQEPTRGPALRRADPAPASVVVKSSATDGLKAAEKGRAKDEVLGVVKAAKATDWFNGDEFALPAGMTRGRFKNALAALSKPSQSRPGEIPPIERSTRKIRNSAGIENGVEYVYRLRG